MNVGLRGGNSTPRRALDEALLEQVRLVDVLERVLFLRDDHGQRAEPNRTTVELLDDRGEDLAVEAVEAPPRDLAQGGRCGRRPRVDRAGVGHPPGDADTPPQAGGPSSSISSRSSAAAATPESIAPVWRTSAKSRTRFSRRLATRGVPRLRRAIVAAPSWSIDAPRMPALRVTMCARSSVS